MGRDILFKSEGDLFSYRVGGILIRDGKVLLQKEADDDGYAVPGGHVSFGETSAETLAREFREEARADIEVDRLVLAGEIFFPWGDSPCQQYPFVMKTKYPLTVNFHPWMTPAMPERICFFHGFR